MRANVIKMDELIIESCICCHNKKIDEIVQLIAHDGHGCSMSVEEDNIIIHTLIFPSYLRKEIEVMVGW